VSCGDQLEILGCWTAQSQSMVAARLSPLAQCISRSTFRQPYALTGQHFVNTVSELTLIEVRTSHPSRHLDQGPRHRVGSQSGRARSVCNTKKLFQAPPPVDSQSVQSARGEVGACSGECRACPERVCVAASLRRSVRRQSWKYDQTGHTTRFLNHTDPNARVRWLTCEPLRCFLFPRPPHSPLAPKEK
jgi:hypothetical protein